MGPEMLKSMLDDLYFNRYENNDHYQDAKARLDKVSGGASFEIVLGMILTSEDYPFRTRLELAYKYATASPRAEKWLLANIISSEELSKYIKANGISDIVSIRSNPVTTTKHLVEGVLSSVVTSQIQAIVNEIPNDAMTEDLADALMRRLLDPDEILEDIPRKEVLNNMLRKAHDWATHLPDSWVEEVFYGENKKDD